MTTLTVEQTKTMRQIFDVMEDCDVIYLTGDAGTGKTFLANHIADVATDHGTVIRCSPIAKISDMINAGEGRTLQSVFCMGGKTVLPEDINYLPGFKGRVNINVIAERVAKEWAKSFTLNKANVMIYIEECMAASAEELYTVRMVMKYLQRNHKLNFIILAVGHPIQQVRDWESPEYIKDEVMCVSYDTKAFKAPRFCAGMEDGVAELETREPFFTNSDEWKVKTFKLEKNVRQSDDPELAELLTMAVNGEATAVAKRLAHIQEEFGTFYLSDNEIAEGVDTYLTPSLKVENYFNNLVLDGLNTKVFLPYIHIDDIKGYVEEFSHKSGSVKIDGNWHKVPSKHYHNFVEAWESIPVPINNRIATSGAVLIRENLDVAKNGESGVCKGMGSATVGVILDKDSENVHTIGYVQSKSVPTFNGEYVFTLKYLPVMSSVALTTGKIQGWTAPRNSTLGICLDAANTKPRPHSFYVALSRAQHLDQVVFIVANSDKCPDRTLEEIITNALRLDQECANFHNQKEVTKPIIKQQQEEKEMTETNNTAKPEFKINLEETDMAGIIKAYANCPAFDSEFPEDSFDYADELEEDDDDMEEETPTELPLDDSFDYDDELEDDDEEEEETPTELPLDDSFDVDDELEDDDEEEDIPFVEDTDSDLAADLQELNDTLISELEEKDAALAEQAELIAELQAQLVAKDKAIKAIKDEAKANIKLMEETMVEQAKIHSEELAQRDAKIAELEAKGLTPEKLAVLNAAYTILSELNLTPETPTTVTPTKPVVPKSTSKKVITKKVKTNKESKKETKVEAKAETKVETKTKVFLDTTVNPNYLRSFMLGLRKCNVVITTNKEEADIIFTDANLSTNSARQAALQSLA